VKDARDLYERTKNDLPHSEHVYQKVSDRYGQRFPALVDELTDSLPLLLNFDKEQLSFDTKGLELVAEALKWDDSQHFEQWFPSVLAWYGQYYIHRKQQVQWAVDFDKEGNVWIPVVKLKDGRLAFDWLDFL
jgi:hypothetical protein